MHVRDLRWVSACAMAAATGTALAFALPPRDLHMLGWFAFLPLLALCRTNDPRVSARLGALAGVVSGLWMVGRWNTVAQFGNLVAVVAGLALTLSAISAVSSLLARHLGLGVWPIMVGCAGVSLELLSGVIYPVSLAVSQQQVPGALTLASYVGAWGVTFTLWLIPAAILAMWVRPKSAWPSFVVAMCLLILLAHAGWPDDPPNSRPIQVAAIQASAPTRACRVMDRMPRGSELVVWPEHLMEASSTDSDRAARRFHTHLVANFVVNGDDGKTSNSACLISPWGTRLVYSQKRHLFGREMLRYARGTDIRTAELNGITIGMPVCFDTEYTDVIRALVRDGARVICVPVSDPDVPNSLLNYLHSAVIPFRAAENGVPVIWSDRHSLSSIYDRWGRRVACAPVHASTHVTACVRVRDRHTLFTDIGDCFAYACALALLAGMLYAYRRKMLGQSTMIEMP